MSERGIGQLGIHYRFLSGFVHPFSERTIHALYGHVTPLEAPRYDHYASELILLYVCYLAAAELKTFSRMTERPPTVQLRNRTDLLSDIERTERMTDYFWHPGAAPHFYDRVQEANQRFFDLVRFSGHSLPSREGLVRPEDLSDDEVRYYRDPLRRLIDMHSDHVERTTGFTWISPWPRSDAKHRA